MKRSVHDMFYDFSVFLEKLEMIDRTDHSGIINICLQIEGYLSEQGLTCRGYDCYKEDWMRFEREDKKNICVLPFYELCIYLFIYQREEHMSGDYGGSYIRAFENGTIMVLMQEIVRRLEQMAIDDIDDSDKSNTIGVSGEYFVMAELTRMGYVASLTSKNTKAIDLLASNKKGSRTVSIQVKTSNRIKQKTWKMSKSVEDNISDNLYYVLVNLNEGQEPSYYIVPSRYLAYKVKRDYLIWFESPGKRGQAHNETTMRTFSFVDEEEAEQYRDAWFLLGIQDQTVEVVEKVLRLRMDTDAGECFVEKSP